jgi:hypothetical protein
MTTRPALRLALAALALAGAALVRPAPAAAQRDTIPRPPPVVIPPRDTLPRTPRDTVPVRREPGDSVRVGIPGEAVRGDTLPQRDSAARDTMPQDTTLPAPLLPEPPMAPVRGWADGSWYLGRRELAYFHGQSLAELIDRIPGLVVTRTGSFGRPMGFSPFAGGGGRFRLYLDGYELRALDGSVPDLQQVPLVNLEAVRIQRTLQEVRIDLTSYRLSDRRPLAQIEGADGDYDSRILRGFFTRPVGKRWMAEIGLDVVETDGYRRREPFSATHRVGRVSYLIAPEAGVQIEYRGSSIDASARNAAGTTFAAQSFDRSEVILRARARLLGRLWVDGAVGRTRQTPVGDDSVTAFTQALQGSARAVYQAGFGQVTAGFRVNRSDQEAWAPDATEVYGRLDFSPSPLISAWGEARSRSMGGVTGVETEGAVRVGPFGGLTLFGQIAAGSRAVRFLRDTTAERLTVGGIVGLPGVALLDTVDVSEFRTLESSLNGFRGGAELTRGRITLGAAYVLADVDRLAPYGLLTVDRGLEPVEGGSASAVEGYVSLPVLVRGLRVDGWYLRFLSGGDRPYTPTQLGRAAIQYNRTFFTGNLEPTIRVEAVARDEALARSPSTGAVDQPTLRYALFNLYVQVRIIDIRIFWRFENLANRTTPFDVPGLTVPGGRALYGVRWFFRN